MKMMEKIMEKGFDLNIIALLYMAKHGEYLGSSLPKIQALVQMMERKGLILEGKITLSGEDLLKCIEGGEEVKGEKEKVVDLEGIYDRMIKRVEKLTGKKQIRTEIFGKTYSYFPSKYDFVTRLKKVMNKYKLRDVEKVEKVIIKNVENCHKTRKWYPLLVYYMVKDDVSPLASDYEGFEEIKEEQVNLQKTNDTVI